MLIKTFIKIKVEFQCTVYFTKIGDKSILFKINKLSLLKNYAFILY